MNTRCINSTLKFLKLWRDCSLPCRIAFTKKMRGRDYGTAALMDAFEWFVIGWRAADIQRLNDAVSQVNTDGPGSGLTSDHAVPTILNMPIGEPDDSYL